MIKKSSERALICPTESLSVFVDFTAVNQKIAGSLQSLYSCAYLVLTIIFKHYFLADISGSDL